MPEARHVRRPRRDDAGFTLVEMLVTVMLLGVLAAFAVVAFRGYAAARSQDGTADGMREVLRQAQQRAVTEGTSMCVDFAEDSWQLFEGACDSTERTPVDGAVGLERGVRFADPAFVASTGTSVSGVTFRSRGTASPGAVTIRRDGSSTERVIEVEGLTGRVVVR